MNGSLTFRAWMVVVGLLLRVSGLSAAVTEQVISHESIAKALSDVKSLQQERQRKDQERENTVPVTHNLDLSKVNSSTEKSLFDGSQFEESLDKVAQQVTLFTVQINQLSSHYQVLKQQAMQQMAVDKKQIEQLTKRIGELEKELVQVKQQLQAKQPIEEVKSTTQALTTLVISNSAN